MYYSGVDGSGLYARILAMDEKHKIVGRHVGGSVSLEANPAGVVKGNFKKLLYEFNRLTNTRPEDCAGICVGVTGGHEPTTADAYENIIKELVPEIPIKIVSDIELILASSTRDGFGTVIVSGVEAAGYAFDRHKHFHKYGGWEHLFCDGGSGYAMGMRAIKCALMSSEGLMGKTLLEKKVKEHFGIVEIHEVLDYINSENVNPAKIAELSLAVKHASGQEDSCAKMIEEQTASDLALLAKTMVERHNISQGKVVLSGNTILFNENIKTRVAKSLKAEFDGLEVIPQTQKSEAGAVYLILPGVGSL